MRISQLFSVTFLAGHGEICPAKFAPTWVDPHGDPQTSPQHANPHGSLVWFSLKRHQVHVDQRVVGWSAGRHADHPCRGQSSQWPARKVTDFCLRLSGLKSLTNFQAPSEFAFAFAAVSLRPRCAQASTLMPAQCHGCLSTCLRHPWLR